MEPKFEPSNPEYKEVKDLPKEQQPEFVNVTGGFVRKGAAEALKDAEAYAISENKSRSPVEQVFKKKETGLGVLEHDASIEHVDREKVGYDIDRIIRDTVRFVDRVPGMPTKAEYLKEVLDQKLEPYRKGLFIGEGSYLSKEQESRIQEEIEKRKVKDESSW